LALRNNASNAAQLITTLPSSLQKDSGLLFDRAQRFRQRGDNVMAAKILAQYSISNDDGHAPDWWLERHILARRAIEVRDYRAAYNLVVAHGLSTHKNQLAPYAEAEWLAGWLALRLNFSDRAFAHFKNFYHHVETPMSKSRAAYWAGYALQVGGDNIQAKGWYQQAAQHPQTFYGQIAAQSLGEGTEKISAFWQRQARGNANNLPQDLVQAVQYLKQTNQTEDAKKFMIALGVWALNNKQMPAFNSFCATQNNPNACLRFNKDAQKDNVVDAHLLFPTIALPPQAGLEGALALSITKQESVFDPQARSPVGALGLMQLMPATAAQTAQKIGVAHQTAWLVSKPTYNLQLGQAYLHQMLERFDGSLPLAVAAYNAGPSNVDKWLVSVGDPRVGRGIAQNDWVNWIEQIPFPETRNYVQRVWEAYAVYSNKP
jgi:soluble lytic murein transglycosylase